MYGYLNLIIKSFIKELFGEDVWRKIIAQSKCPANFEDQVQYNDDISQKILDKAVQISGMKREMLLSMLGEHYLDYIRNQGHDDLLRNLGDTFLSFLENLDYIHTYMMSDYPEVKMPSFRCEASSHEQHITLHYYSYRKDYYHMVIGLLKAISKTYFNTDLKIEIISKSTEEVAKKKPAREHIVFGISPMKEGVNHDSPPTFVAHTKKAGEQQILKSDVENVMARLEEIRKTEGEDALPINKAKGFQAKWKAVARMSMLRGVFRPEYPEEVALIGKTFCDAFPYHVVYNSSMEVVHTGTKLQQMMPGIRNHGSRIDVFFDLLHPHSIAFSFENVSKFINTPFVLKIKQNKTSKEWSSCPSLVLRGQMKYMEDNNSMIYICSPFVRSLNDLEERNLHLSDIPIHDVTRDLLWMELVTRHKSGGQCPLRRTPAKSPATRKISQPNTRGHVIGGGVVYAKDPNQYDFNKGANPSSSNDVEQLRKELAQTQAELEEERQKNAWIYHSFLPPSVADQVINGQTPDAGEYQHVSALFCDVVGFTQIIARCKPRDIVNLLTQLHAKFHHVCDTHDTYRVDAIGDAFLVICGAPEEIASHAERIANTALGMCISAREVNSPFDYGDRTRHVKIRIGVHTGPVIGGAVGDRVPKYLVMGDTINMTSKMESHGVPDKIHVSQQVYQLLRKKPYRFEKRGNIDIRGKGKVTTYILIANEQLTEEEIVGKSQGSNGDHQSVEVTFINDGRQEHPPRSTSTSGSHSPLLPRHNRVAPNQQGRKAGSIYPDNPTHRY